MMTVKHNIPLSKVVKKKKLAVENSVTIGSPILSFKNSTVMIAKVASSLSVYNVTPLAVKNGALSKTPPPPLQF